MPQDRVTPAVSATGSTPIPRRAEVPRFLVVGATWAWRFLVVVAAVYVIALIFSRFRIVVLPVAVALLFTALLSPLVGRLDRWMPRLLAVWLVVAIVVGGLVGVGYAVQAPIRSAIGDVTNRWDEVVDDTRSWLVDGPLALSEQRVDEMFARVGSAVERFVSGWSERPASTARLMVDVVGGTFLALVLTFFFLKDGPTMWRWMIDRARAERRTPLDRAGRAAYGALQGWLRGVAITGVVEGTLIGMALVLLGVPAALPLAFVTFLAAFFPIVGATLAGVLATGIALVSNGMGTAVVVALVVLAVQQIEGDVLLPVVMYRQVSLHPVVVLTALAAGSAVAGVLGAVLAVPATAAASAAISAASGGVRGPTDTEADTDADTDTGREPVDDVEHHDDTGVELTTPSSTDLRDHRW